MKRCFKNRHFVIFCFFLFFFLANKTLVINFTLSLLIIIFFLLCFNAETTNWDVFIKVLVEYFFGIFMNMFILNIFYYNFIGKSSFFLWKRDFTCFVTQRIRKCRKKPSVLSDIEFYEFYPTGLILFYKRFLIWITITFISRHHYRNLPPLESFLGCDRYEDYQEDFFSSSRNDFVEKML